MEEIAPPLPFLAVRPTFWRMPRRVRGDPADPPRLRKTLEDAPFYSRSALDGSLRRRAGGDRAREPVGVAAKVRRSSRPCSPTGCPGASADRVRRLGFERAELPDLPARPPVFGELQHALRHERHDADGHGWNAAVAAIELLFTALFQDECRDRDHKAWRVKFDLANLPCSSLTIWVPAFAGIERIRDPGSVSVWQSWRL